MIRKVQRQNFPSIYRIFPGFIVETLQIYVFFSAFMVKTLQIYFQLWMLNIKWNPSFSKNNIKTTSFQLWMLNIIFIFVSPNLSPQISCSISPQIYSSDPFAMSLFLDLFSWDLIFTFSFCKLKTQPQLILCNI